MRVGNVSNVLNNQSFKGHRWVVDETGAFRRVYEYPFDYKRTDRQLYYQFYKVKENRNNYAGIEIIPNDNPPKALAQDKKGLEEAVEKLGLKEGEGYITMLAEYSGDRLLRTFADTGQQHRWDGQPVNPFDGNRKGEFNFIRNNVTMPVVQGSGEALFMDSLYPELRRKGFESDTPGQIYKDENIRKALEGQHRTYSNVAGGNSAGLDRYLDIARANGTTVLYLPPYGNGDSLSSHGYWNKCNNQLTERFGTTEDYENFTAKRFAMGMKHVFDATFIGESLLGVHFNYAMKWANKLPEDQFPDEFYMFNMETLKDSPITFGVIPKDNKNIGWRIVNAPNIVNPDGTVNPKPNKDYEPGKPTYFQVYDKSFVTKNELADTTKLIKAYEKANGKNPYKGVIYTETCPPYYKRIYDWKEFVRQYERTVKSGIDLNSIEGIIALSETSDSKFGTMTEGVKVWDAKNDIPKMRYSMSAYDEHILENIEDSGIKKKKRERYQRSANQAFDMMLESLRFWSTRDRDVNTLALAKITGNVKSADDIDNLIIDMKLPPNAVLTDEQIQSILDGDWENLRPIGEYGRNDTTLKALMKYPLDSLELGDDTLGVLSSPYLASRATKEDQLGKTMFELMLEGNPQVDNEHGYAYRALLSLFSHEIKGFTNKIVEKLDEILPEKLIENGEYTEYGEYVIDAIGPAITKFVFLKALGGKYCKVKTLEDGRLTYNYDEIRENTGLLQLGIKEQSPSSEAQALVEKIACAQIDTKENLELLVNSFAKMLENTSTNSFRLADAIYIKSGLALDYRFDAIKDYVDWDSVRVGNGDFNTTLRSLIKIVSLMTQTIKKVNPATVIMGELTDIDKLLQRTYSTNVGYDNKFQLLQSLGAPVKSKNDVTSALMNKTGLTTLAGYDYFFSSVTKTFAKDFETGNVQGGSWNIKNALKELLTQQDPDYVRNMFSFVSNFDKQTLISGLAVDMELYHSDVSPYHDSHYDHNYKLGYREQIMKLVYGVERLEDLPLEIRLNIDNPDYFKTINTKAAAMSMLIRQSLDELPEIAEERKYIYEAIANLTNGQYMEGRLNEANKLHQAIDKEKLPALYSIEGAINEIFSIAGIQDHEDLKNTIASIANNNENLYKHLVVKEYYGDKIKDILGADADIQKYSPYVTSIASLIKDIVNNYGLDIDTETRQAILNALKDFVVKYDLKTLEANSAALILKDSEEKELLKENYGAGDIETNIGDIVKYAKTLAEKDGVNLERFNDKNLEALQIDITRKALTPAINKAASILSILHALPGTPTTCYTDNHGKSGNEGPNNRYLRNRDFVFDYEGETSPTALWHKEVMQIFQPAMQTRSLIGLDALNKGSYYVLEPSDADVVAYLAYTDDSSVISIMDLSNIDVTARDLAPVSKNLNHIYLGENVSLPEGTMFYNAENPDDKTQYVIRREGDNYYLRTADGSDMNITGRRLLLTTENVSELQAKLGEEVNKIQEKKKDVKPAVLLSVLAAMTAASKVFKNKILKNGVQGLNIRV